jgi:hypothetical protein
MMEVQEAGGRGCRQWSRLGSEGVSCFVEGATKIASHSFPNVPKKFIILSDMQQNLYPLRPVSEIQCPNEDNYTVDVQQS